MRRPREDEEPTLAAPAVRQAALQVAALNDVFNPHLLKFYYQFMFPYRQMYRWLSYGTGGCPPAGARAPASPRGSLTRPCPPAPPPPLPRPRAADPNGKSESADFFHRREFTFTLENDVFVRYMCFKDAEELARDVMRRQPERIEIGPVYTARPSQRLQLQGDKFKPTERELIFDIDLNDYDDVRTCCVGAKICQKCWAFINVAIRVLDAVLRIDFGFQHIMFVYSGRRGMHCWVSDAAARGLTNEQRSGVVEYINCKSGDSSDRGGSGAAGSAPHVVNFNRVLNALTTPLLPSFARAYADLESRFVSLVVGEEGQALLASPQHWTKVLDCIPESIEVPDANGGTFSLKAALQEAWPSAKSAEQRWNQLRTTVRKTLEMISSKGNKPGGELAAIKRTLDKLLPALVLAFSYPRLDVEVSKHRNHLLKAPFCIHPKTGRVCVPLTAAGADAFDPSAVPTVGQLMREGQKWLSEHPEEREEKGADGVAVKSTTGGARLDCDLVKHTSLAPYLDIFESFLRELYADLKRSKREKADKADAQFGDKW